MKWHILTAVSIAFLSLTVTPFGSRAQEVIPVVTGGSAPVLLPDKAPGFSSSAPMIEVGARDLDRIVGEKGQIYREYRVDNAVSRQYGSFRVDLFRTLNHFTAAGLFSFEAGIIPVVDPKHIGSGSRWIPNGLVFWQSRYFVRVSEQNGKVTGARRENMIRLAGFVSQAIGADQEKWSLPPLLDALPVAVAAPALRRYVLGPDSLETHLKGGREMFGFEGDAEAVIGEYQQPGSMLKLAIVEYHTPQFAHDALEQLKNYVASLPVAEQDRIIYKREGNYIVEAHNVLNRELGEHLVNSVEYPYGVKWLRDPRLPTQDPFRAQKAAQILLSSFGIIGLVMGTALIAGGTFGAIVFAKRRKRLRRIFSDAGGMLRLDIEPIPGTAGLDGRLLGAADDQ